MRAVRGSEGWPRGDARPEESGGGEAGFAPLLVSWLHSASIEVSARDGSAVDALRDEFDPGTEIFINFPPGGDWRPLVAAAVALRRAGFEPVPHVAARAIASRGDLDAFLARLAGEAGTRKVLAIAGDGTAPRGPFASTLEVLSTGLFERHGIASVGVAGHPEEHPAVAAAVLDGALLAKRDLAAAAGLDFFIVTQFAFEAGPVLDWLDRLGRLGIGAPVRIGLAGPASVAALVRFGLRCGVGASLRAIRTRSNTVGRLIGDAGPEDLVHDLAAALADGRPNPVAGLHFYPFGGIARTSQWRDGVLASLYDRIARAQGA